MLRRTVLTTTLPTLGRALRGSSSACAKSLAPVLACVACSGEDVTEALSNASPGDPVAESAPTFHGDVAPIFNEKCTSCHQQDGIGPFVLTDYGVARERAGQIAAYTAERLMPPFLMETGGECGSFDESMALSDAQIATIAEWAAAGAPEGVAVALPSRPLPVLEGGQDFDLPTFAPEIMGGPLAEFDEYRCFPVELGLTSDQYVTGYEVIPGNDQLVHHVLAYLVDPNQAASDGVTNGQRMQALDAESPDRVGWPCFGMAGAGVEIEALAASWAPGQGVVNFVNGIGVPLRQDRVLVAQVHYNLAEGAEAGATDQTKLRLRLADRVERQAVFLLDDELLDSLFTGSPQVLPAGQESVVVEWTRRLGDIGVPDGLDIDLVGLFPHMHELGRKYTFEVGKGGDFECQARINRWDFNWQRLYDYTVPVRVDSSSEIRVTCDYDTRRAPADVLPGWGTRNEMCFVMGMFALPPGVFL